MSRVGKLYSDINGETICVEFSNDKETFSINLTNIEEVKSWPLNDTIENHFHINQWINFINRSSGSFTLRYRKLNIKDDKLIVINDPEEVDYYGFEMAIFDLENIRITTYYYANILQSINNIFPILSSNYQIKLQKGNIIAYINGIKEILVSNINHAGDTYYEFPNDWQNNRNMSEIVSALRENKISLRFRNSGKDLFTIFKRNDKYYFKELETVKYIFEDSISLQKMLDDLILFKWN